MAARTFEDSTGIVWEVFEVQRASHNAQAVSAGLERGWLAFVSGSSKRRLAPFPAEWQSAETAELERLCKLARAARAMGATSTKGARGTTGTTGTAKLEATPPGTDRIPLAGPRPRVPRIRSPRDDRSIASAGELPIMAIATSSDPVEDTVRAFAHQARVNRLPAIEAMVQLKALLSRVYTDAASDARDLRAVRRWFVEAYYFEREVTPPDSSGQSR